jgi:hypothetical protein
VHADGWKIDGCPVNGPAVAARENRVVVAWFTSPNDSARVSLAFSDDGGATFSPPVRSDDGHPLGRVDVGLLDDGTAVVSWLERTAAGAEVRVRSIAASGRRGPSVRIGTSSAERASGFPRMASTGKRMVLAWTDPGRPSHIRVAWISKN